MSTTTETTTTEISFGTMRASDARRMADDALARPGSPREIAIAGALLAALDTKPAPASATADLVRSARAIVDALNEVPCTDKDHELRSCVERERIRRPTAAEKRAMGGVASKLPFHRYNVHGMCTSCRAYWHAENAARELEEMAISEKMARTA